MQESEEGKSRFISNLSVTYSKRKEKFRWMKFVMTAAGDNVFLYTSHTKSSGNFLLNFFYDLFTRIPASGAPFINVDKRMLNIYKNSKNYYLKKKYILSSLNIAI